jgi:hypothetical protein
LGQHALCSYLVLMRLIGRIGTTVVLAVTESSRSSAGRRAFCAVLHGAGGVTGELVRDIRRG